MFNLFKKKEEPLEEFVRFDAETYKGKRIKRGLFLSSEDKALNADINGSLNILKRGDEI